LSCYRTRSYAELVPLVEAGQLETLEISGPSGANYQLEFQFFWDDKPRANVRVIGSIDDGGWRAYFPPTASFILGPEGNFVGE
jgi:hypothetical protein